MLSLIERLGFRRLQTCKGDAIHSAGRLRPESLDVHGTASRISSREHTTRSSSDFKIRYPAPASRLPIQVLSEEQRKEREQASVFRQHLRRLKQTEPGKCVQLWEDKKREFQAAQASFWFLSEPITSACDTAISSRPVEIMDRRTSNKNTTATKLNFPLDFSMGMVATEAHLGSNNLVAAVREFEWLLETFGKTHSAQQTLRMTRRFLRMVLSLIRHPSEYETFERLLVDLRPRLSECEIPQTLFNDAAQICISQEDFDTAERLIQEAQHHKVPVSESLLLSFATGMFDSLRRNESSIGTQAPPDAPLPPPSNIPDAQTPKSSTIIYQDTEAETKKRELYRLISQHPQYESVLALGIQHLPEPYSTHLRSAYSLIHGQREPISDLKQKIASFRDKTDRNASNSL